MSRKETIVFIALCAVFTWAKSQNSAQAPAPQTPVACPAIKDLINTDLFGPWVLELRGSTGPSVIVRLVMVRNPEFAESLAGSFILGSTRHEVFGDIEDGALELEESTNGKDIIALWRGNVQEASCGQAITGVRKMTTNQAEQNFVLRRGGW
jgi:hypothetical protein